MKKPDWTSRLLLKKHRIVGVSLPATRAEFIASCSETSSPVLAAPKPRIPLNGVDRAAVQRFTVKRTAPPAFQYAAYPMRCQFAVETVNSLRAPEEDQCIELEMMFQDAE
jgi:hypothetical protein